MRRFVLFSVLTLLASSVFAETAEIRVDLQLDGDDFIAGERVRGIVNFVNSSPKRIGIGAFRIHDRVMEKQGTNEVERSVYRETFKGVDHFFVEVFRSSDMRQLPRVTKEKFVPNFYINSSEGQKLETHLADHYDLSEPNRYLAKPVFVHDGSRYEGQLRAFDIVEGVKVSKATQLFATRNGLQREFTLVYWSRRHSEHLFLTARDTGASTRRWETRDLGPILRIDMPSISILPSGEVDVLHRLDADQFVRTEFWSLPNELAFRRNEVVKDPETAGTARVRELYKEGGVKPKTNPWWKFW